MTTLAPGSILVVDDDHTMRTLLCDTLREAGYRVHGVRNGLVALNLLRAEPQRFRLILLDLMMPDMNGWQFRREQLDDPTIAHIPVVVLSAGAQLRMYARPDGIAEDAFLTKPWDIDQMLALVAQYYPR